MRGKPGFYPSIDCCGCFCPSNFTFATAIVELRTQLA
jgi:hypothetical protein